MSDDAADYCFAVEVAVPDQGWRGVELEISEHDEWAKGQYLGVWQKLTQALVKQHELAGKPSEPAPEWSAWRPGEWCEQKKGYEGRQKYVARSGPNLVGFLNCWPQFSPEPGAPEPVLYLEHIAAAPGNMDTILWRKRFRYVGQSLFAFAVLQSRRQGYGGRLGLHVADDLALGFYQHLSQKLCDGGLFRAPRTDVLGPTPRGSFDAGKTYLETAGGAASALLEGYRRA